MATKRHLETSFEPRKRQHTGGDNSRQVEPTITLTMTQLESIIQQRIHMEVQKVVTGYYGTMYPPMSKDPSYIN